MTLPSALDLERNRRSFTADDIPDHAVVHPKEARNGTAIDFQDLVPGLQAGLRRGRILLHVTDHRRQVRFAHRMADGPDDAGEEQGQEQTEKRAGDGDDDFVERGNPRQRARSTSALPSITSIGASCGSFTNPPNGSEPSEYWTPLIVFFQIGFPNQTPKPSM